MFTVLVKGLLAAMIMLAGFFLATFAHPAGWVIVFAGFAWLVFALLRANLRDKAAQMAPRSHPTPPENRDRGSKGAL